MNVAEASRQYQLALEHRRSARATVDGCVSFEEEIAGLDGEVALAADALDRAWLAAA